MAITIIQKPVAQHNYGSRRGHAIIGIVIHIEDGNEVGTDGWFANPRSHVSSHYSVAKTGEVHQYVGDQNAAQHAGVVDKPTWWAIMTGGPYAGTDPNYITLGIEHEGKGGDALTPEQLQSSAELVAMKCKEHGIPLDDRHVIPHHAIRNGKTCPGAGVDIKALIDLAKTIQSSLA